MRRVLQRIPTAVKGYCLVVLHRARGCSPVPSRGAVVGRDVLVAPGHRSVAYTILCRGHTPMARRKMLSLGGLVICLSPTLEVGRRSGLRPPEHLLGGNEHRHHMDMVLLLHLRGMTLEVDACCQKTMPP